MTQALGRHLLLWMKSTDGSLGMKYISSRPCPGCGARNVRRWDMAYQLQAYQCGDCKEVGVEHDKRQNNTA